MNDRIIELSKHECLYDKRLHKALIAIEDKRFLFHRGHDIPSIVRAFFNNVRSNRIQGASTIEQQLVRIILKENAITFRRKIVEILLSAQIYGKVGKSKIIDIYFDNYIFSNSTIGLKEFCEKEGYNIDNLTDKDICEIIARIKYPTINSKNYLRYLRRVRTIEILSNSS